MEETNSASINSAPAVSETATVSSSMGSRDVKLHGETDRAASTVKPVTSSVVPSRKDESPNSPPDGHASFSVDTGKAGQFSGSTTATLSTASTSMKQSPTTGSGAAAPSNMTQGLPKSTVPTSQSTALLTSSTTPSCHSVGASAPASATLSPPSATATAATAHPNQEEAVKSAVNNIIMLLETRKWV